MRKGKDKCSLSPQNISDDVWYYENPTYMEIYHQEIAGVKHFKISRRKLNASLNRMNKSK